MQRGERYINLTGTKYIVAIFPPSKSFRVLSWIGDIVGESLGALVSGSGKSPNSPDDLQISDAAMALAAKAIFRNLHRTDEQGRDGWDLIIEILSNTSVVGGEQAIPLGREIVEVQFIGKMGDLVQLVAFVLKENYTDFLSDVLGLVGTMTPSGALQAISQKSSNTLSTGSPSEPPSTGASGAS